MATLVLSLDQVTQVPIQPANMAVVVTADDRKRLNALLTMTMMIRLSGPLLA